MKKISNSLPVYLNISSFISTYNKIKKNPNKVWLKSDFSSTNHTLDVLVRMKLMEVVPGLSRKGKNYCVNYTVRGYKLIINNGIFLENV